MEKEILKYLEQGISIDGNPKDGYTVFTIKTQHFKISSLDELSVERFEKAISDFNRREELENQLLREMEPVQHDWDWRGFIDGKYDNPKPVLAEVPKRDFEWVCNECNFPNLTSSVSEDEIVDESHSCIKCGCFEMHKRYFS